MTGGFKIEDLSVALGSQTVLSDITFEVPRGAWCGLIGVNELLVGPSGPTPESATPEDADSTPRTPTDNESRTISA